MRHVVHVPVIASGGAGAVSHFARAIDAGADAVLAASLFHFGELSIGAVKEALAAAGHLVRPVLARSRCWRRRSEMRIERAASGLDPKVAARLKRNPDGLVAAIAQQHDTGEVLMLGWMDDEALHRTLTTGRCTYWSRSRAGILGQGRDLGPPAAGGLGGAGLRR